MQSVNATADSCDVTRVAPLVPRRMAMPPLAEAAFEGPGARHRAPEPARIDEHADTIVLRAESLRYGRHAAPVSQMPGGILFATPPEPNRGSDGHAPVRREVRQLLAADDVPSIEALVKQPGRAVTDAHLNGREEAGRTRGLGARLWSWLIRADNLRDATSAA